MTRFLVVLIASIAASACASVRSDITVSHTLPQAGAKTVAIVPYDAQVAAAPDFTAYTAKLAAHLQAEGYTVVAMQGGQTADYIAYFYYGVNGATPINPLVSAPAPNTGSIITSGQRTPYSLGTRRFYTRTVILEILDRARYRSNEPQTYVDARVYSGWVKSDGACSTMASVIDPMLTALFAEFPGGSRASNIEIAADAACGPSRFG